MIRRMLCCLLLLTEFTVVEALEPEDSERLFVTKLQPLLISKCGGCHGEDTEDLKGQFDMRSRAAMLAGGESETPAIVPGKAAESLLVKAIEWREGWEMPPKENDRLTTQQIDWVRQWIDAGAPWPTDKAAAEIMRAAADSATDADGVLVSTSGGTTDSWTTRRYAPEDLWAYQPLQDSEVPWEFANGSTNPIDAFINRELAAAEMEPLPPADDATLLRRLTYDLTGLPPTAAELASFDTSSAAAYRRRVEELLARPQYGERWAQHWLDVVRYADTAGFANDHLRPHAWRYRDYVIRAFNNDKPYDQFIREQIAGDEIDPSNPEHLIAVGFLRMGPWEHTAMSVPAVTRQQFLDDVTNSVGVTFLGHELRCAKCHDHKFDPIPTRDYYGMQAIFSPVQFTDRDVPFLPEENLAGFESGRQRIASLQQVPGVQSLRTLPKAEWPVESFDEDTDQKGRDKVRRKRTQALEREAARFLPRAMSVYSGPPRPYSSNQTHHPLPPRAKRQGNAEPTHILTGGSIETPAEAVQPAVLSVVRIDDEPFKVPDSLVGRRAALAEWLTAGENPLTARVMVNRVWQAHFGTALAGNPNNFGATGKKPTHPELLDFLAKEFVRHGWSIKKLHERIVTSDAWRRSSGPLPDAAATRDPENRLLSVFPPRRLTAEELRDTMLMASGELNLQGGGLPARPEIHLEVAMQPRHIMGSVAPAYQAAATPAQRHQRTVYTERIRTLRDPLLEVFNQPGPDVSCERRDASTITPQAFTLLNSQNSFDRALALADRVRRYCEEGPRAAKPARQIAQAFLWTLGRQPTDAEATACLAHFQAMLAVHQQTAPTKTELPMHVVREMVEEMTGLTFYWVEDLDLYHHFTPDLKPTDVDAATRALAEVALVLFNSNEFAYLY